MSRIGDLEDRIERAWWRLHDVTTRVRSAGQQARERWLMDLSAYPSTDTTDPDYVPPHGPPFGDDTYYFELVEPTGGTAIPGFDYQVREGSLSVWGSLPTGGAIVATGTTNSDGIGSFPVPGGTGVYTVESAGLTWTIGSGVATPLTRGAQGGLWTSRAVATALSTITTSADKPHTFWQSSPKRVLWVSGSSITDRWGTWSFNEGYHDYWLPLVDTPAEMFMYARSTGSGTVARNDGTVTTGSFYIYYYIAQEPANDGSLKIVGSIYTRGVDTFDGTTFYPLKSTETQPALDSMQSFSPHQEITTSISSYTHPVSLSIVFTSTGSDPDFFTLAFQGGSSTVTWTEG